MEDKKVLLDAAALLVKLAGGNSPVTDPKMVEIIAVWEKLVKQFEDSEKPHDYVEWGTGVLPDQAGTNEKPPRSYDTHRSVWEAAQRDKVELNGKAFNMFDYLRKGPDAVHEAIVALWNSAWGKLWRSHPLNQYYLPRFDPQR